MPPWPGNARADTGAGRQGLMQPIEADFVDFHPAIAGRRQAAMLEGLAATLLIEQGKAAVFLARCEQGPEKVHGEIPVG